MSLVLLADDEPAVLEVLSEVVEDLGHEVLRAKDGQQALMLARTQRPHLVVTDHMMPQLSGLELCRQLRRDNDLRHVPVILISAALPREVHEANACLAKPFELGEFERAVRRALESNEEDDVVTLTEALVPGPEVLLEVMMAEMHATVSDAQTTLDEARHQKCDDAALPVVLDRVTSAMSRTQEMLEQLGVAADLASGRSCLETRLENLHALFSALVEEWQRLYPGLHIRLLFPDTPALVRFDARQLRRVADQLLRTLLRRSSREPLTIELSLSPSVVTLRFGAEGLLLGDADRKALFEPHRIDPKGRLVEGGGLYLAAEMTKLMGGALSARSFEGHGTTLTLTLPRQV